jgi:hypothetical protein
LKLVFEDRNKIMHGHRVAQAKSDHAWTAVSAVEFRGTTWTRAPRLTWSIYRNCAAAARVDARLPRSIPTHCPHMDR